MSNIEKIRQEIERRLKYTHDWLRGDEKRHPKQTAISKNYYKMKGDERTLDALLAFIDSLPEDASCVYDTNKLTPTPSANIEDVARVQFASHAKVFDKKRKAVFDWEQFKEVAGIFYGFGKRDSMPEEKPSEDFPTSDEEMAKFLATHPKVEVPEKYKTPNWLFDKQPEDLEEAAEKYIQGSMCDLDDGPSTGLAKESFIAGAKWQKEQKQAECNEDTQLLAGDYAISHYEQGKTYSASEVHKMLADAFIAGKSYQKQEWSEEEIIYWNIIKDYFFGIPLDDKLKSALDWFKSLKPSWKPSEQDIKMLEHIIGQYEIGNKNSKVMGYLPRIEELDFLKKVLAKWKN